MLSIKYLNPFNSFSLFSHEKREDFLSAGVNGFTSIVNGLFSRKNTKDTNAMNYKIAQETNAAQERIAAANNQTQVDMMRENNAWSKQQAIDMFNLENAYNTPEAQRARLLAAGFNPAVALGNGGVSASTGSAATPTAAGSTVSPSMPNFVTPTMQTPPTVIGSAVETMSQLASAYATYKQGQKTGKEVDWFDEQMKSTLKKVMSEANYNEMKTNYEQYLLVVDSLTLLPYKKRELAKLDQEIITLAAQGKFTEAQTALANAEERVKKILGDREEKSTPIILDNLRKQGVVLDSEVELNKASTVEKREEAVLHRKQQFTEEKRAETEEANASYLRITTRDTLADYIRKIDDAFELYFDENGDVHVDKEKLEELKALTLKEAKNRIRQQNQDYWNPFHYIGALLGGAGAAGIKVLAK